MMMKQQGSAACIPLLFSNVKDIDRTRPEWYNRKKAVYAAGCGKNRTVS